MKMLTVRQCAEILAVKESTIRAWLLHRKLAKVRVGARAIRIPVAEVERLIEAGFVAARERR
jgi:excisionase family DNA binding protein